MVNEFHDMHKPVKSYDEQMQLLQVEAMNAPTFSFTQEIIDYELTRGSNIQESKMRIYNQFINSLSSEENIKFLKNEYGWGGGSTIHIGTRIGYQYDGKGITLTRGKRENEETTIITWNVAEKRIKELIKLDKYLNSKEKEEYSNWLKQKEIDRELQESKKKLLEELVIIFWIFIIGSILGYIFEMIVVLFQKGYFESRQGLIYGPFTPVYGIGGIAYYITFKLIKTRNKGKVFFVSMILGGLTEYIASYVQEKAFGTISWDYSYLLFNLNGRTSLLHCTYWGIAGILYILYIEPKVEKMRANINKINFKILTSVLSIFMVFNITISCLAAERQKERRNNIEAENKIDIFLDNYYPDEYMDKIFANKKNK